MSDIDEDDFDDGDYPYTLRSTSTRLPPAPDDKKKREETLRYLESVLESWVNDNSKADYNPMPHIQELCKVLEESYEEFLKKDPDPLDDRHPYRTHPKSTFGNVLKTLFRNDDFMHKLVVSYILGRDSELSIQSCRLLLGCVPGLDSNVLFSDPDDFIPTLYQWAKNDSNELLQAYSMGLLASALENQENASKYRSENETLIPVALRKLVQLKEKMSGESLGNALKCSQQEYPHTSFAHLINGQQPSEEVRESGQEAAPPRLTSRELELNQNSNDSKKSRDSDGGPPRKRRKTKNLVVPSSPHRIPSFSSLANLDNSNSKWDVLQPFLIGNHKIYPLTTQMYQRYIFQYLTPTGEYQDLLSLAYEGNALDMILEYIDLEKSGDVRLSFDALKYLTSLLVHRKFALEFVNRGGVNKLLKVPRNSLASVGVVTCFYYLSYTEDVMEKICQLEDEVVDELVSYALWCLEHSHESGMASASMFFASALYHRAILERFDNMDGSRKLHNYISTLTLMQDVAATDKYDLTEEQLHTSTQAVRNACSAFKSYISVQLFGKLEYLRRIVGNQRKYASLGSIPSAMQLDLPRYKSTRVNEECVPEAMKIMTNILRFSTTGWRPIEMLQKLGVFRTVHAVAVLSREWNQSVGKCDRQELMLSTMEILAIGSCSPVVQNELIETQKIIHLSADGISTLMQTASDEECEGGARASALFAIINCIFVPADLFKAANERLLAEASNGAEKRENKKKGPSSLDQLEKMWTALREADGLMVLCSLVKAAKPTPDADRIRALACYALEGFARCPQIRQILSNLPLIANNELQGLMREPLVPDKRTEHAQFCREAMCLIETVTQNSVRGKNHNPKEITQERLWKSWVVANTKINYNEKELLQLIHEHLRRKGLTNTANLLRTEADLPDVPASRLSMTPAKLSALPHTRDVGVEHPRAAVLRSVPSQRKLPSTPSSVRRNLQGFWTPSASFATPSPIRFKTSRGEDGILRLSNSISLESPVTPVRTPDSSTIKPCKVLDDIITEYLRGQHTMCSNPVTTCPPFSLFYPHKCPEPKAISSTYTNIARRFANRDLLKNPYRTLSTAQDERYVFSRFRPVTTLNDHEETYTACSFSIDDVHMIVGMYSGDVHWINIETQEDEATTHAHHSAITEVHPSTDGSMLLTSSAFMRPLSALWRLGESAELLAHFPDDSCIRFSNLGTEKILGTENGKATVYDTETLKILNVYAPATWKIPRYTKNFASFSPCDSMIFNDGYLWDIRSSTKPLFMFDKLNSTQCGVFHPNGNEVIINTEVWDVRTHRLLRSVPALDSCRLKFNSTGNIMYASHLGEVDDNSLGKEHMTWFKTFDTSDYSVITTMNLRRRVYDICCDHSDKYMAVIEQTRSSANDFIHHEDSQVRIIEVGKRKDAEDAEGDEEEEVEDGNEHSDSENDSSDIDTSDEDDFTEEGVFDVIGRLEEGRSDSESESESFTSDSSGWETASNPDGDNNDDDDDANMPGGNFDFEDDEDFYPPPENTSSTPLNPHLRNQGSQR
ncbi:unnamed protein product [Caenorhabditis auriculariae]|uniref:LisH domain-containing protein n=1 Tax=Caenorhabditis auriculariae TaxID=2777116 RepID=A0A8S1HFT3_9PELO|nr:unnamed protein product [Caenorhabditis auriculariae]